MKTIKTLLKENDFKSNSEYYDLIIDHFARGNHIKCSNLFQDLKRSEREFFLCSYLNPDFNLYHIMIKFFIRELIQG